MDRLRNKYLAQMSGIVPSRGNRTNFDIGCNDIILYDIKDNSEKYINLINNSNKKRYILRISKDINFNKFINSLKVDNYDIYNFRDGYNYVSFCVM